MTTPPPADLRRALWRLRSARVRVFDVRFDLARPDASGPPGAGHLPGAHYLRLDAT